MLRNTWIIIVGGVVIVMVTVFAWLFWPVAVIAPPIDDIATSTLEVALPEKTPPTSLVIGTSVEGRQITAYTYGNGPTKLLFVGGVHGGYEWNSVYLAYRLVDYLTANPSVIPTSVTLTIIPALNPDGLFAVVGTEGRFAVDDVPDAANTTGVGRLNAHNVDLNRNFDCKWQSESTWKGNIVNAGVKPFSEPEAAALRDYILKTTPEAAIFWHSAANTVYGSECEKGILPSTLALMDLYSSAASYKKVGKFDAYPITGDVEGWLASINIPAITVELESHDRTDWERNLAAVLAVLKKY